MAGPGRPRGGKKYGGRVKGTPNKVTAEVKKAILAAFDQAGGVDYLARVAREDAKTLCALLGKLVPAEVNSELSATGPVTIRVVTGIPEPPER